MSYRTLLALSIAIVSLGCDRSGPEKEEPMELETVDVGGGPDAGLTTDFDEKAKRVEIDMGGVLPSDFPEGMPIFSPSSVVDLGPGFVEMDTPVPLSEVRSSLGTQIQRAGWTVDSIGEEGSLYRRNGQQVRVELLDPGSGTRIRYRY